MKSFIRSKKEVTNFRLFLIFPQNSNTEDYLQDENTKLMKD